jgi:mannose-6-phosphate isomerase-like protein (cupin superfamily)
MNRAIFTAKWGSARYGPAAYPPQFHEEEVGSTTVLSTRGLKLITEHPSPTGMAKLDIRKCVIPDFENVPVREPGGSHRQLLSHECIGMGDRGSKRLSVDVHRYQVKGHSVTNVHSVCEQGYFILEGEGEVRVGDETYDVSKGSYVFIPRHAPHSLKNTGDGELILLFMSIDLDGPD